MLPGIEVGLPGWQRAHSQPAELGIESPAGILYAPPEVNLVLQRAVERELRSFFEQKAADVEFYLTTVTRAHPGTLRLAEIQYTLEAVRNATATTIWETSIGVGNARDNPRITIDGDPHSSARIEEFLRPVAPAPRRPQAAQTPLPRERGTTEGRPRDAGRALGVRPAEREPIQRPAETPFTADQVLQGTLDSVARYQQRFATGSAVAQAVGMVMGSAYNASVETEIKRRFEEKWRASSASIARAASQGQGLFVILSIDECMVTTDIGINYKIVHSVDFLPAMSYDEGSQAWRRQAILEESPPPLFRRQRHFSFIPLSELH
ncbi:MAG: hypothetical protein WCU88_10385 [Elusimicrobiota bacterium]